MNTGFGGITYNGTGVVVDNGEGGTVENTLDFKGRFTELTLAVSRAIKKAAWKTQVVQEISIRKQEVMLGVLHY